MKKTEVTKVTGNGTWNGKDGTLFYQFIYEFADGETINASHKTPSAPFEPGDQVAYEIQAENSYGKRGKVSKPEAADFKKEKDAGKDRVQNAILYQSQMKAACELIAIEGFPTEAIDWGKKLKHAADTAYQLTVYANENIDKL